MSKRQDILDNLQTTLENITEIKTVIMHQPYAVDTETIVLPCASVWTLSESESGKTGGLIGKETWDWNVGIEVWYKPDDSNFETLLKIVNDALYVDGQRGGCAIETKRINLDEFEVYNDRDTNIKGFSITLIITYYHEFGVM